MALASEADIDLRKKLLRRLLWKAPLVVALVTFAVWWEARQRADKPQNVPVRIKSPSAASWAGVWQGEASYPQHARVVEQFVFRPEGEKLFGTASYLRTEYAIQEGRVSGDDIFFFIRFAVTPGGERQISYRGKIRAGAVKLFAQDETGTALAEVTLVRSGN